MDESLIFKIVVIAVAVQFIVEAIKVPVETTIKYLGKDEKVLGPVGAWLSIGFGMVLCAYAGLSIFTAFGVELGVPYLGETLTGGITSLGANRIYDMIDALGEKRATTEVQRIAENELKKTETSVEETLC